MHPKRREKGLTKAKRVLKIWRAGETGGLFSGQKWTRHGGPGEKRMVHTRKMCNKACCRNPRHLGFKHRKELIADDRQRQQINDLDD